MYHIHLFESTSTTNTYHSPMHLKKVLRQINLPSKVKLYESGVKALIVSKGSRRKGKVCYVKSRPGPQSSQNKSLAFWEASKHAEFVAIEELVKLSCNTNCNTTIILFRVLPSSHPRALIPISEQWALGSADMCKSCVEMLQKTYRTRKTDISKISWLTPDSSSENQLRPAVPNNPVPTVSYMRYHYHKQTKSKKQEAGSNR